MAEFSKYQSMRENDIDGRRAYFEIRADGFDQLAGVRMLRQVYGLSLIEAKKISFEIDTGESSEIGHPELEKQFDDVLKDLED